jgi:tetratricopeptide (TPR) repeat protein
VRIPVRERFDIGAFGVNAFRADEPGVAVIEEHDEAGASAAGHEELYLVVSGHATFAVAGEEVDAPAGTLVFVRDPATRRGAVAREAGTTVLAVGGARGEPFTIAPWEASAGMWAYYQARDYAGAVAHLRGVLEEFPENATVAYNLACCESLAGQHDDALEHLRQAIDANPEFRDYARTDVDFDPLRNDPRFSALAGEADAGGAAP